MSSCWNRALSRSLYSTKNSRLSTASSTSTKTRTRSSRKGCPSYRQCPRIVWVSQETAQNRSSNSTRVSATKSSGTGVPSLNRRGRSTSKRRSALLIGGRPLDGEWDALHREERQGGFRHEHRPARPTLEGEPPGQAPKGPAFRLDVREADEDHE